MVLFFKIGPFKSFILQPLLNANFHGLSRLQDEGFERIKFLRLLSVKIRDYLGVPRTGLTDDQLS